MTPDVTIRDMYNEYIFNARKDYIVYEDNINQYKEEIKNNEKFLLNNVDELIDIFEYNVVEKIINKSIDEIKHLYSEIYTKYNMLSNAQKGIAISVIRHFAFLKHIKINTVSLIHCSKRKNMKFSQFREYVAKYYNKVHEIMLKGDMYKYGHGIGIVYIGRKTYKKPALDTKQTKINKAALIAAGKTPYCKEDAELHKRNNMPYDGIDYRAYKQNTTINVLHLNNSRVFPYGVCEFRNVEYINTKYRNNTYDELSELYFNKDEAIFNAQVDLIVKVNMYVRLHPNIITKYEANSEKYSKVRAYNCKT